MIRRLFAVLQGRRGQGLVEYGILVAGIALVCLAAVAILGHKTNDLIASVAGVLPATHSHGTNAIASGQLVQTMEEDGMLILNAEAAAGEGYTIGNNLGIHGLRHLVLHPPAHGHDHGHDHDHEH